MAYIILPFYVEIEVEIFITCLPVLNAHSYVNHSFAVAKVIANVMGVVPHDYSMAQAIRQ